MIKDLIKKTDSILGRLYFKSDISPLAKDEVFLRSVALLPIDFWKFFFVMIRGILSRSQRRPELSTILIPNMKFVNYFTIQS